MTSNEKPVVSEHIHRAMDELTGAERKVARTLLADYPAAGLGSAQALAYAAGTSAPTVVRLATQLGFEGFAEMRSQLRTEISSRASSPVLRTLAHDEPQRSSAHFDDAMNLRAESIAKTLSLVPLSEFESACRLLAGCRKRIVVTGGYFSTYIARIFALQLAQVRQDVTFAEDPLGRDVGLILDAKKGSVFVLFDLRRYESQAASLAELATARGAQVLLMTDRWMSPVAEYADVVMPVEVEATPFDSFVALLAVAEVTVEAVMHRLSTAAIRRMQTWEDTAVAHTQRTLSDG